MPLARILSRWTSVTDEEVAAAKDKMGLNGHTIRGGLQLPDPRQDARVAHIFEMWTKYDVDVPPYPDGTRSATSHKVDIFDTDKNCVGFVVYAATIAASPNKVWVVMY